LEDLCCHHGDDQIAFATATRCQQRLEAETAHGDANGVHVAVVIRACRFEELAHRHQPFALERSTNCIYLLGRQRREIGQCALANLLALAERLAQQDRGRRVAVGHDVDMHGYFSHVYRMASSTLHVYIWRSICMLLPEHHSTFRKLTAVTSD